MFQCLKFTLPVLINLSCLVGLISLALKSPSILIVRFFLAHAVVRKPVAVETQQIVLVVRVVVSEDVEI